MTVQISHEVRYVLSHGSLMLLLRIAGAFVAFFLTMMVTRVCGASDAGVYFFVISALLFCGAFSMVGMNGAILKEAALKKDNNCSANVLIDMSILCLASSAFVGGCVSVLSVFFVDHYVLNNYYLVVAISIFPFSFCQLVSGYFQTQKKTVFSALYLNSGYQFLLLILILGGMVSSLSELLLAFELVLYSLTVIVFLYVFLTRKLIFRGFVFRIFSYVRVSISFMGAQIVAQFSNFATIFLVSIYLSSEDISYFSVCMRVAVLISFVSAAVARVSAPRIAVLYSVGKLPELRLLVIKTLRFLMLATIPVYMVIIVFSDFVLGLFGGGFSSSSTVLLVLAFGQVVSGVTGIVYYLLQMTGHEKEYLIIVFFSALVTVFSCASLLPQVGLIGAAYSTSIGIVLTSVMSAVAAFSKLKINPLAIFLPHDILSR